MRRVRRAGVVRACVALVMCIAAVSARAQTAPPSGGAPVRAGLVVRPDTVEIGDLFQLVVTVEVPSGARVTWPTATDSSRAIAVRTPPVVTRETVDGRVRERAEFRLTAWDVGTLPLGLPDAVIRTDNGTVPIDLRTPTVVVRSVLPGDTSLHVPKPARPPFPRVVPWWERWWPALAVLVALTALWWTWRRWRARPRPRVVAPALDPLQRAHHDFDRLQRLELLSAGERGRGVALAVEIVRVYLAARVDAAPLPLTTDELLAALEADAPVPYDRLRSLLVDADVIKFAGRVVSSERAAAMLAEARALVDEVERRVIVRRETDRKAQEVARAAHAERARAAQAQLQDDARRKSRRPTSGVS